MRHESSSLEGCKPIRDHSYLPPLAPQDRQSLHFWCEDRILQTPSREVPGGVPKRGLSTHQIEDTDHDSAFDNKHHPQELTA